MTITTIGPAACYADILKLPLPMEQESADASIADDSLLFECSADEVQYGAFDKAGESGEERETQMEIPGVKTSRKVYMDYRTITAKSSKQWKLQQEATTDELGFRRYGDYYMVAMGTYYTGYECGKVFRITLENGSEFLVVTGDIKSDVHTDAKHQHRKGNVIEFIVDTDVISQDCKSMGDMSYCIGPKFKGNIQSIHKLDIVVQPVQS